MDTAGTTVLHLVPPSAAGQSLSIPALPDAISVDRVDSVPAAQSRLQTESVDCLLVPGFVFDRPDPGLDQLRDGPQQIPTVVLLDDAPGDHARTIASTPEMDFISREQARERPELLAARIRAVADIDRQGTTASPYRTLFAEMNAGAAIHELLSADGEPTDYRIVETNRAYESILGIAREQATGVRASRLYESPDPPFLDRYATVVETGDEVEFETYYPPQEKHFRIAALPLGGSRFATVFTDITDMQQTEQELTAKLREVNRLSEYRRVMSAVNQQLVESKPPAEVLDTIAEIIASGPRFTCAQIQLREDTTRVARCQSTRHPDDATLAAAHAPSVLETVFEQGSLHLREIGSRTEDRDPAAGSQDAYSIALTHEGERFGVLTVTFAADSPIDDTELELLDELASDIGLFLYTRQVETHLREREERLELALEGAELGVWDWDMETDAVYRDDRYAEMLGYDPAELGGTVADWAAILHPNARETHDQALEKHLQGEAPLYACEYRLRTKQGEWKWIRNIGKVVEWEAGTPKRAVGVHQDIDDRKRTRQRLKRNNELLHAIDRVLRHNTNNHMNVIQGFASTLAEEHEGTAANRARRILESSQRLLDTIDKERRITRLIQDEPRTERIDLAAVLRRLESRIRDRHPGADLTVEVPETLAATALSTVEEAIEELVTNSIIHAGRPQPTVRVRATREEQWVAVAVTDDGPGIPEMDVNVLVGQEEITPLYHGSGLGLWFVSLVVDRSDGLVSYSGPATGDGSTVLLKLPRQ
jgi:PAS domain S-box-containing protein